MPDRLLRLLATSFLLGGCTGAIDGGMQGKPGQTPPPGDTSVTRSPQCASAPLATGAAYLRRLTRWEYANSVTDTLNVKLSEAQLALIPSDIRANGFSNDFGGQLASFDSADHYSQIADAVGTTLAQTTNWLASFAMCSDTGATCRDNIIRGLGLRLFRRPVTPEEATAFGGLFDLAVAAGIGAAPDAARHVVRAMLQSPQFLYRLEAQTPSAGNVNGRALDSYEFATRLSYLTWGSAPDQALLDAAAKGDLASPDKLQSQVARMLAQPRARENIQRYFREWLTLDDLDDATRGPNFTPALAAAMKQETLDDVADQLWDGKKPLVSTMLTTRTTIVSPVLAPFYGLGMPDASGHLSLAGAPNRVGLLTQAGVLTVDGDANASIVQRGLFVFRNLLCQEVGLPPPGATAVMLAPDTASERQKSDARLQHQPCQSCHGEFDPLAYAFEPFDSMGQVQTKDANGNAVRQDGYLPETMGPSRPYDSVLAYMDLLAKDPRVSACVAAKIAQFAWGRALTSDDQCMVADIQIRMNASANHSFADLITAVATNANFRYTAVK
ncbi:MAG TPA: DUF1592 domain-containing protein [Polyangia bacterium]|nr:DUF1592 domain-containing protein [Polyangia bacterium]